VTLSEPALAVLMAVHAVRRYTFRRMRSYSTIEVAPCGAPVVVYKRADSTEDIADAGTLDALDELEAAGAVVLSYVGMGLECARVTVDGNGLLASM
jgi:hypothetical protein